MYEVRIDGIDNNDEAGQSDCGAGEIRTVDAAGIVNREGLVPDALTVYIFLYMFDICSLFLGSTVRSSSWSVPLFC